MSKATVGFFHVAFMNGFGGLLVAAEMHGRIMQSGLYDSSDAIKVVLLGDSAQAQEFKSYVLDRHAKYEVVHISPDIQEWEWPTLKAMSEYCKVVDCDVWYAHTKGASNCRPDVHPYIQRNIRSWRGVMCHDIMTQHSLCKELLKEFDAVGPLLSLDRWVPHFVGNFWWATADHIRTLPSIPYELSNERAYAEAWIGSREGANLRGLTELVDYDCYDFQGKYTPNGVFFGLNGAS